MVGDKGNYDKKNIVPSQKQLRVKFVNLKRQFILTYTAYEL